MTIKKKDLSLVDNEKIYNNYKAKIGIVVSEWNSQITNSLLEAAHQHLLSAGIENTNIIVKFVPGSFELPLGAQFLIENSNFDAVICLGCVIQGETRHFDFICNSVANSISNLNIKYSLPVIFGVLTTNDMQQAIERSGGKHGNKGIEAAQTAIKMINLKISLSK